MTQPKISILIPTYYAGKLLDQCLASINRSAYPSLEAIIIDNSPKHISLSSIKKKYSSANFKFIKAKKNLYFANGINLAFSHATGQYIFIANDDIQFKPNSLSLMLQKLQTSPRIAAVHPQVIAIPDHTIDSLGGVMNRLGFCFKKTDLKHKKQPLFYLSLGLYRKQLLDQTGVYDPQFTIFWEDADLSWRIWLSGRKIVSAPQAVVLHQVSSSAKHLPSQFSLFHVRKNRFCGLIKNYSLTNLCIYLPLLALAYLSLMILETLKHHNLNSLKATTQAIIWNLTHLPQTLEKRCFVQTRLRRTPDSSILKLLF